MEKKYKLLFSAIIGLLSIILAVLIAATVIVYRNNSKNAEFIPPEYDSAAVKGVPDIDEQALLYGTAKLKDGISVSICGNVHLNGKNAEVYFTADTENIALVKLQIFDGSNNLLGETGVVRPGEYVKDVKLDSIPDSSVATAKIVTYEEGTYYSLGTATASVNIIK